MARGSNKIEYEVLEGWEQLPEGWSFVEVAGVAPGLLDLARQHGPRRAAKRRGVEGPEIEHVATH